MFSRVVPRNVYTQHILIHNFSLSLWRGHAAKNLSYLLPSFNSSTPLALFVSSPFSHLSNPICCASSNIFQTPIATWRLCCILSLSTRDASNRSDDFMRGPTFVHVRIDLYCQEGGECSQASLELKGYILHVGSKKYANLGNFILLLIDEGKICRSTCK